jgi:hypothetical protein
MSQEPIRFRDPLSEAPPELRALLDRAHKDVPSSAELAGLAAKTAPLFGTPSAATGLGLGAKLGLLALGLSSAVLVALGAAEDDAAEGTKPTPVVAPAPDRNAPPAILPPASSEQAGVVAPSVSPSVAEPAATPPSTVKKAEKPGVKLGGPSEAELLESARRLLASNPGGALELAQQHRARFRGGVLAQEREVIAIEALRRLGRSAEADARADAFERAFPNSAHRRKLDSGSR